MKNIRVAAPPAVPSYTTLLVRKYENTSNMPVQVALERNNLTEDVHWEVSLWQATFNAKDLPALIGSLQQAAKELGLCSPES